MHVKEKNVIITGGSSGIGKATAKLLASEGANVFILARGQGKLDQALLEIEAERVNPDQRFEAFSADVTSYAQVEAAIAAIAEANGPPDILINCAGMVYPGHFDQLPMSSFRDQMDLNYFGTLHMVKAVLPHMKKRGSGHIVNISSFGGVFGGFGYSAYGASKFAVCGFTEALRAELKPHNIAVSLTLPSDTETPQLEKERELRPREIELISGTGEAENLARPSEFIAYWLAKFVLSDNGDAMNPNQVARAILKGIKTRRYLIFPDTMLKIVYYLRGLLIPVANWAQDQLVEVARRERGV